MQEKAIEILSRHDIMAIATVRPDGWPQNTLVGYVNEGLTLFFLISRSSQKFANLAADDRASIAIGTAGQDPHAIEGLSMAAHISEVRDEPYRSEFSRRLAERHPGYFDYAKIDFTASALMRARPAIISVVDFSTGLGHADILTLGSADIAEMQPARADDWGPNPAPSAVTP